MLVTLCGAVLCGVYAACVRGRPGRRAAGAVRCRARLASQAPPAPLLRSLLVLHLALAALAAALLGILQAGKQAGPE